jgi:hypothetical protein
VGVTTFIIVVKMSKKIMLPFVSVLLNEFNREHIERGTYKFITSDRCK